MRLWLRTLIVGLGVGAASEALAADSDMAPRQDHSSGIDPTGRLAYASLAELDGEDSPQGVAADAPPRTHKDTEKRNRHELTIGAGGGVVPSYVGSDNYVFTPGLAIRGKIDDFSFSSRGTNFNVDLWREAPGADTDIILGPAFNYRADRTRRISDTQVRALGKLDAGWEVGGWIGIRRKHVFFKKGYDTLSFRARIVKDIGGGHRSYMVSPSVDYGLALSPSFFMGLSVSADYVGKGFGRQYFNVTPAGSAASGLPVYTAAGQKAGWLRTGFSLAMVKSLSGGLNDKGWSFLILGNLSSLQGRYKNSPIVSIAGSRTQKLLGAGFAYTF